MIARLSLWLTAQRAYATVWPLRSYAIRSGERVCGTYHRKLPGGRCRSCGAAL